MNILLVYPKFPESYSNYNHALNCITKKTTVPPLDLNMVLAILPEKWIKRLVDLNISSLRTSDIQWADYVFISAMYIQKNSVKKIIAECKKFNKKIIAAGMLFTHEYAHFLDVDHFILNEAEVTLPLFLADLESGQPQIVYATDEFTDLLQWTVEEPNAGNLSYETFSEKQN